MIAGMKAIPENMLSAAQKGFINATDLADYLTKKGMPFRAAYKIVGQIVAYCVKNSTVLEKLTLEEYKGFDGLFDNDLYQAIDLAKCVESRISAGGTGLSSIETQIEYISGLLEQEEA